MVLNDRPSGGRSNSPCPSPTEQSKSIRVRSVWQGPLANQPRPSPQEAAPESGTTRPSQVVSPPVRVGAFGGKGRCGAVSANVDDHEHVVGVDQGPVAILGPKAAFARCQELLERAICHAEYFQRRQLQPAQHCHNRRRRRLTQGALLRTSDASFVASDSHPSLAERRELVMSGGTRWYVWRMKGVERGGAAILI